MPAILNQRNFFVTKRFEITEHSLKVAIKSPVSYIEDEFPFEEITKKYTRKKTANLFTLIPCILCIIGVIITVCSHLLEKNGSSIEDILVYGVLGIIFLVLSVFNFENVINLMLVNGRLLSFYADSPNKIDVDAFLELLLSDQKKYLLNRYAKSDPYVSAEQSSANLKWLRDRNIIDDAELTDLQAKILPKPGGNSSVGFRINPGSG